jgi:outer membrane protein OmpA-like peptidoglycan-associated protein
MTSNNNESAPFRSGCFAQKIILPFFFYLLYTNFLSAQTNLLVNGGFEDINTCTEYNAECGVEGWFYLRDIQAQMLANDDNVPSFGNNSFGLYYKWTGYSGFYPVIGALLPCRLQKDKRYIFAGTISAKLNGRLDFKPGVFIGEKFYVPNRSFSATFHPDTISQLTPVRGTNFYQFTYSFVATGLEKYLTFGTFVKEDTRAGKRAFIGTQSIALALDNFQLEPEDKLETWCNDFITNKAAIYNYNFRHKEMDYALFSKGELTIPTVTSDSGSITLELLPPRPRPKVDTLKLGDVFFDFNKSDLKPPALEMLQAFFVDAANDRSIDSIYIDGHTDSIGNDSSNIRLSRRRCEAVWNWLEQNKVVTKDNVQIRPFGKSRPVTSNSTPQGRAMNRRVELIVFRR